MSDDHKHVQNPSQADNGVGTPSSSKAAYTAETVRKQMERYSKMRSRRDQGNSSKFDQPPLPKSRMQIAYEQRVAQWRKEQGEENTTDL